MSRKGEIFIYTLAGIFTLFGIWSLADNIRVVNNGAKLQGLVIGYEARDQSYKGRSGSTDAPIVRFEYQNQQFEIPTQMSSAWHGYEIGDKVTLYFDPDNQREVLLDSPYHKYGFGGMFFIFGILLGTLPRVLTK